MNLSVDWTETSSYRAVVRTIVFIIGIVFLYQGKDVTQVLVFGTGINALLGYLPDKTKP